MPDSFDEGVLNALVEFRLFQMRRMSESFKKARFGILFAVGCIVYSAMILSTGWWFALYFGSFQYERRTNA